jgi:rubrerythrin
MELKESKTAQNLKDAFAGESQANRRYLYFAQKAEKSHAGKFQKTLDAYKAA